MEPSSGQRTDSDSSNWLLIKRLLKLSWEYRAGCIKVLGLQVLLLAIGLSGLGFTGIGIDFIRRQILPNSPQPRWPFHLAPPADWPVMGTIGFIAAAIFTLALFRAWLNYFYTVQISQLVQGQIVVNLRARVYNKLQRLSFRFFDDNASGSIINRVTRDVQATRVFIDGVFMQGIVMTLSLVVFVTYMVSIHPTLTLACLATTPLLWIMTATFSRIVRPAYLKNRELYDHMILVLAESIQGIPVIKGFAREAENTARFHESSLRVCNHNLWIFSRISRFVPSIGLVTQINLVILLAYGGYLVIQGALPLGAGLIVFAGLLQQFSSQVANVSNLANNIQESLSGARRVFEILDTPVEIRTKPDAIRLPQLRGGVQFDHVSFGYDPADRVLNDISFTVQPGQCMAILGATGSGKSTLMSLIPRFYDPTQGRVFIDGVDARTLDVDDLRRHVGIVFQDSFLFSNTIAANIAFGSPDATDEQIQRAAKIAAAHDFITALPAGYNTVLGESGADLSGGQRQRIAIARAILLEPSVLLLDDPTAAIDPETEQEIMDAMNNAMTGRTTFVVAHRLSTLRRADRILVLERGRVVQMGTHEELMSVPGPYRGVALLQVVDDESLRLLEEHGS